MTKSSELYEERREYPRIVINSPVNILYKIHRLEAKIHDISPEGIQIRANGESLKKINLYDENFTDASAPLLDVTFSLKLYEMDMRINALCKMYYSNSLFDEEERDTACGLKFINFEGDGSSQLDAFITQEMTII
jgi:c-di-GMP-binding flagellar brake protein YcgR